MDSAEIGSLGPPSYALEHPTGSWAGKENVMVQHDKWEKLVLDLDNIDGVYKALRLKQCHETELGKKALKMMIKDFAPVS